MTPAHVELILPGVGNTHAIVLPNFADREEVVAAWARARDDGGVRLLRAYAAALGLGTRIGRHSGARLAPDYDASRYGGDVYSYLVGAGIDRADIARAGEAVVLAMGAHLAPRKTEVEDAAGPLGETGAPSTGGRSE